MQTGAMIHMECLCHTRLLIYFMADLTNSIDSNKFLVTHTMEKTSNAVFWL